MWNLTDTRKYERYILDILDLNKSGKGRKQKIQRQPMVNKGQLFVPHL